VNFLLLSILSYLELVSLCHLLQHMLAHLTQVRVLLFFVLLPEAHSSGVESDQVPPRVTAELRLLFFLIKNLIGKGYQIFGEGGVSEGLGYIAFDALWIKSFLEGFRYGL